MFAGRVGGWGAEISVNQSTDWWGKTLDSEAHVGHLVGLKQLESLQ